MAECNPKLVPADPNSRLTKQMCPTNQKQFEAMRSVPYREAVGSQPMYHFSPKYKKTGLGGFKLSRHVAFK